MNIAFEHVLDMMNDRYGTWKIIFLHKFSVYKVRLSDRKLLVLMQLLNSYNEQTGWS